MLMPGPAMGVKFVNKDRFFRKLNSIVPMMATELTNANSKSASEMVDTAKRLVPVEDGTLQESVRSSKGSFPTSYVVEAGGETTTRVGAGFEYDYALAVEFSTQKMNARPFFWPAYRIMRRKFKGRASRAINQSIKKAGFSTNGR